VPGKTYRLRVVNTSAFAMFFFWIDGHDMRVIEVCFLVSAQNLN
jgi:iron transport multicopper oxidase